MSDADPAKGTVWVSERINERAALQQAFASDPKYKKYTQQIEKCLNSFDNVHEWADCIAFLKQLLKTFQSYMQFKEIPRKLVVAKRLSQCLTPALPTGVHQRALDVYAHILAVLGSEGLRRDLPLWSSGLFPFFEYASTSVKPTLLNLYDTHYLPLQAGLRPVMKSFILALLPGLEEETGEFFDKVLNLLDRLSGTVSLAFFFQNVWLIMLTTPSARGTSLNYLSRRLPQLTSTEQDITTIVGRDFGLMIRAFSAALEDENLLVRRGALDLLLQFMRVDSETIRRAQPDDRAILMRAAVSVVLRRDLSLNRRLYTWLLGPDEKSEQQAAYIRTHSLQLLTTTLKEDMVTPSSEYSESRPFKIFISLLDKWEIGAPLSEALAYDAFSSVKNLIQDSGNGTDDIMMTASTLYEAIEPQILWRSLLSAVLSDIAGDGSKTEAVRMVQFILNTFSQDEEIQIIHLPILLPALTEVLMIRVEQDGSTLTSPSIREGLLLLEAMLKQIPQIALSKRPELSDDIKEASNIPSAYKFACTFYGINPSETISFASSSCSVTPFASTFENLTSLSSSFSQALKVPSDNLNVFREGLGRILLMLNQLTERLDSPVILKWYPSQWFSTVLATLGSQSSNFTLVDRVVTLAVTLHQSTWLEPSLSIDQRSIMHSMVTSLLGYLRSDTSLYHARAVNLIWALETSSKHPHVEAIVAQSMSSTSPSIVQEAYETFGVLWRLTEDNLLPGFRFKVPMMLVLDALKSDDPTLRRIGETWMRCSLKSYLRVLDPIMFDLMDPTIRRVASVVKVGGRELQGFSYERPFDQRYINHLLDALLSVIRFGGQGFSKTARSTAVRRSYHAGLIQRMEQGGLPSPDPSYLDTLVEILLRFLQSEPQQSLAATMEPTNTLIQSIVVDLLQTIVGRGEIDPLSIQSIEAVVIGKLYYFVHTGRLNLQNKLLHLLHSLISASKTNAELNAKPTVSKSRSGDLALEGMVEEQSGPRYPVNPLLIHTLVDGISMPSNRPVLQHWLDFVLMAIPQFQPTLQGVVAPLNDCLCRQLLSMLTDVHRTKSDTEEFARDLLTTASDSEFIMLLNGLERLVLLSLAYTAEESANDEEVSFAEKSPMETTGILGYVSNVFGSESIQQAPEQLSVRSPGYRALHEAVRVLYALWKTMRWTEPEPRVSIDDSLALICTRTRLRTRRVLEHLFRVHPSEVFESIVECWNQDLDSDSSNEAAFELVDVLIANVQNAVHLMCESISCRIAPSTRKQVINPDLNETVLFTFLEEYLRQLEGPLALQVWSRFLQLVKDIVGGARDSKTYNYPLLRSLTVLAEKITQTTAMEDRRIRKDVQENFGRLLDACVAYVGRTFDSGSWIRRTTEKALITNGRDSPVPRGELKIDEKLDSSNPSLVPDTPRPSNVSSEIKYINDFIATSAVPNLRRFLLDNDKVLAACTNIMYYIAAPAMKSKTKPLEVEDSVLGILREISRIPAALKAWKTPVGELLNDNKVFTSSAKMAESWAPIVRALFDMDKAAFPELLSKVTTTPSANIFTSREYEMLLRSLNLRRLSFVLFTGEKNHFLTQLPSIQEKLVDILKNVTSAVVQSEVYLCIRVLLYRLSPHNLTSFWPVVLTELYRLFDQAVASLPSDGSEDLQLILAASKCLDLLLTLQTEDFQIHQWIFITDTVDAIYRPNDWFPLSLLDQLAEVAGNLPRNSTLDHGAHSPGAHSVTHATQRPMRRPMLNSLRQIDSIRDLVPFFSSISISSYENVYASGGAVDLEAVEKGLLEDMFDGR